MVHRDEATPHLSAFVVPLTQGWAAVRERVYWRAVKDA
ncbi:hypothetical protein [Escherichia coli]